MATSRYVSAPILGLGAQRGTSRAVVAIRAAVSSGALMSTQTTLKGSERLDTIAGDVYGDGRYWWVIAAASNIGWSLQVPAGTLLTIPDLAQVLSIVGSAQ